MNEIIKDISNKDYHAHTAISRSMVNDFKKSPMYFYLKNIQKTIEPTKSKQTNLGSLVHTLCLEKDKFEQEYFIKKKLDGRTKEGKEQSEVIKEMENKGLIIVDQDELDKAMLISSNVMVHPMFKKLTQDALFECCVFWEDEETKIFCKAKPDIFNPKLRIVCDLKTISNISSFQYSIEEYGYHIQAAMQIDSIRNIDCYVFFVVQTEEPFNAYVYEMDSETIEKGREEYKTTLKALKKCFESDLWKADTHKIRIAKMPPYLLNNRDYLNNLREVYCV